jgi:hypothetical protein
MHTLKKGANNNEDIRLELVYLMKNTNSFNFFRLLNKHTLYKRHFQLSHYRNLKVTLRLIILGRPVLMNISLKSP